MQKNYLGGTKKVVRCLLFVGRRSSALEMRTDGALRKESGSKQKTLARAHEGRNVLANDKQRLPTVEGGPPKGKPRRNEESILRLWV